MKQKVTISKQLRFRFMAMSKLIGLVAFAFVFMITIYAMNEMHNTGNYDALPQLIISAFGFASVYSGFYLTMDKVEHVEDEKSKRKNVCFLISGSPWHKNKISQKNIAVR